MSEVVGLIEVEDTGDLFSFAGIDRESATLDSLFARLVGKPVVERVALPSLDREPSMVVLANLDVLADDLNAATREVLADIFLSLGRR
jgi:hypothetical protein